MPKPFSVAEIREAYLSFFAAKGCVRYASASLVPENDPTTLFTVAGMSQFKDMFLGRGTHPFSKATTVQKCIRTNDILNVGRTARHHTFFEMLGNFSFNDYFKREAIHWAWEFLTTVLEIPAERLSVTVHVIDDEAYAIWRDEIKIPVERIFKLGDADNFWPANAPSEGPEGPGGCCSEIFYDHRLNDDPTDNLTSSTGRFVEIWNLVFPQFNVRKPHPDGSPNLEQLGRTNIDTGSGLERVAAVMQGVYNNFDIDVFQAIIAKVCERTGAVYDRSVPVGAKLPQAEVNALIRRIADHVRAVTFCISDGALPGNTDRGYIVRRLIRRATLDLDKLGCKELVLGDVVPAVVEAMAVGYPELRKRQGLAQETLRAEEQLFRRTLAKGLDQFQRALERNRAAGVFAAADAFELVATHGFPKEVIAELAAAEGLTIDEDGFKAKWAAHQAVSNSKSIDVFTTTALQEAKPRLGATPFTGYQTLEQATTLTLLEVGGEEVTSAPAGSAVRFALVQTPFYAESGGQVSDVGEIIGDGYVIRVTDVQKDEGLVIHSGTVASGLATPGAATARVDATARAATVRHHSATHLLHSALNRVVGDHVEQQGSRVGPDELRFDFNSTGPVTREQQAQIENWVNEQVRHRLAVLIREVPIAEAKSAGAKALFGEKYGAVVRVVAMGQGVSTELCGGCHVQNTGEIAGFRIVREEACAAGIRRITAVAGEAAAALAREERELAEACARHVGLATVADPRQIEELARLFKAQLKELPARVAALAAETDQLALKVNATLIAPSGDLVERVAHLHEEGKRLRKLLDGQQAKAAAGLADEFLARISPVAGVPVLAAVADGLDAKALRTLAETLKAKRPDAVIVLGAAAEGKVALVTAVGPEAMKRGLAAGALIAKLAPMVGGGGGGKPDFAQAGGKDAAGLAGAMAAVPALVKEVLASSAGKA
jgi:alanyl-tRNA synthetase